MLHYRFGKDVILLDLGSQLLHIVTIHFRQRVIAVVLVQRFNLFRLSTVIAVFLAPSFNSFRLSNVLGSFGGILHHLLPAAHAI